MRTPELLAAVALAAAIPEPGQKPRGHKNKKRTPSQQKTARRRAIAKASRKRNRG